MLPSVDMVAAGWTSGGQEHSCFKAETSLQVACQGGGCL